MCIFFDEKMVSDSHKCLGPPDAQDVAGCFMITHAGRLFVRQTAGRWPQRQAARDAGWPHASVASRAPLERLVLPTHCTRLVPGGRVGLMVPAPCDRRAEGCPYQWEVGRGAPEVQTGPVTQPSCLCPGNLPLFTCCQLELGVPEELAYFLNSKPGYVLFPLPLPGKPSSSAQFRCHFLLEAFLGPPPSRRLGGPQGSLPTARLIPLHGRCLFAGRPQVPHGAGTQQGLKCRLSE